VTTPSNYSADAATPLPRARGGFVKNVLTLMSATVIAQILNILGTLLLAHLFSPDDFGVLALFVTIVSLLSVAGGARYELGIMLPERDDEAANLLLLSTLVLAVIAGVAGLVLTLFHNGILRSLGTNRLAHWLWSVPLVLFITAFYQVLAYWCGRMKQFRRMAIARVCQAIVTVTAQTSLFFLHLDGGLALIIGWIIGQGVATGLLFAQVVLTDGRFLVGAFDAGSVRRLLGTYKAFPIYKAPYSFVSNAASQLVYLVLKVFSSLDAVGLFSVASRAVYLPVRLASSSMNQVFYEKAATELKYGRLEPFVTRSLRIQILVATPVLILVASSADILFGLLLGPKWASAGIYAAMLIFPAYLNFLTAWLDRLFDVQGQQRLSLILATAGNFLQLGGLYLALWMTRNTALAVGVYAGLGTLYAMVWLAFVYWVAKFGLQALLGLAREALLSVLVATAVVGSIHAVLSPWPAFYLSAVAVFFMEAIIFYRHVPVGRSLFTRLRAAPSLPGKSGPDA
jgi:O-antigen/teichoic acid export membrane protein